jgi:hypothetical protein
MTQDQSTSDVENRFEAVTEPAEIARYPSLKVSGLGSQVRRGLFAIDPRSTRG